MMKHDRIPLGYFSPFEGLASFVALPEPERPSKPKGLPRVCAASLAGKPVPPRKFLVPGLVPARTTTLLTGDGGLGKSTLAGQLAVGVSTTGNWLGLPIEQGPAVFLSAEDELDELHRRLYAIADSEGLDFAKFRDLTLVSLAGHDAVMGAPDKKTGLIRETPIWRQLIDLVEEIEPRCIIIDTLADVFAGNEIIRAEARQFIGMLNGLAIENNLAVVVLSHSSLSGMSSGTGTSGSTAWSNSVRSRLYLESIKVDGQEVDTDLRVLKVMKANYAKRGTEIRLRWRDGVFVSETPAGGFDKFLASAHADRVFLDLLGKPLAQGRDVSSKPSQSYAPTVFEKHPSAEGIRKREFGSAMERLLMAERIFVETGGSPSRRWSRLVLTRPEDEVEAE